MFVDYSKPPFAVVKGELTLTQPDLSLSSNFNVSKEIGSDDTLVVDTGSWRWRAGLASQTDPRLQFEPLVHKTSAGTFVGSFDECIASGLKSTSSRLPYDDDGSGGILTQQHIVERLLDHVYSSLGVSKLDVCLTEKLGNPPAARQELVELVFEAYEAPRALLLLDGPCSAYWNFLNRPNIDCHPSKFNDKHKSFVSINIGDKVTTVTVVLKGSLIGSRRISGFGGTTACMMLQRLLHMRYPLGTKLTLPIVRDLYKRTAFVASDYDILMRSLSDNVYQMKLASSNTSHSYNQTKSFSTANLVESNNLTGISKPLASSDFSQSTEDASNIDITLQADEKILENLNVIIQLPYVSESAADRQRREQAAEALRQRRLEMAETLRQKAAQQKERRIEEKRTLINSLRSFHESLNTKNNHEPLDDHDDTERPDEVDEATRIKQNKKRLREYGYSDMADLLATIDEEQRTLDRLLGVEAPPKEAPDYSILDIEDKDLSEEKIREKRRLRLLKASADARERQRVEKEQFQLEAEDKARKLEFERLHNFESWANALYNERDEIIEKLRQKQRASDSLSDRRSAATSSRLRNVVSLIDDTNDDDEDNDATAGDKRRKKAVSFGDSEADWAIYRDVSLNPQDDEDAAEEADRLLRRLSTIESELEKYDGSNFASKCQKESEAASSVMDLLGKITFNLISHSDSVIGSIQSKDPDAVANQIVMNVERVRVTESLFTPNDGTSGVIEIVEAILAPLSGEDRDLLAESIFVTGGASNIPGITERIEKDLRSYLPENTTINVTRSPDHPELSTWRGASTIVTHYPNESDAPWMTRSWYDENGGDRVVRPFFAGNTF